MLKKNIYVFDSLPSTNDEAKRQALLGAPSRSVYVAKRQSAGRGRLGRKFLSMDDNGLYFSILLRPLEEKKIVHPQLITLHAAMSVCGAIEEVSGQTCDIKWPNDILINDKKICGILSEASVTNGDLDYIIVGVGLNVNNTYFDSSINIKASSLYIELKQIFSKTKILDCILNNFFAFRFNINSYKQKCISLGKKVDATLGQKKVTGTAVDVDKNGAIIIVDTASNEKISISSGDVCVQTL